MVSNLSFGSGVVVFRFCACSPDPRQHPFGSGKLDTLVQLHLGHSALSSTSNELDSRYGREDRCSRWGQIKQAFSSLLAHRNRSYLYLGWKKQNDSLQFNFRCCCQRIISTRNEQKREPPIFSKNLLERQLVVDLHHGLTLPFCSGIYSEQFA